MAASFAGRNALPAWYLNLIAEPQVGVQVGGRRIACRARVLEPGEAQGVAAAGRHLPAVRRSQVQAAGRLVAQQQWRLPDEARAIATRCC